MSKTRRILVVDDDVDTCGNLSDILGDLGYSVATAANGKQALALVDAQPFDVAILDFKMPDMDGVTLYREIKKRRAGTLAVIVTAYSTAETVADALHAGVCQVLRKPVVIHQLLDLVDQFVKQPTLLVVDDDHDLCENLWEILRERDVRVCLASSESEARRLLAEDQFHVVLIDMQLPEGDGQSVMRLVRDANPNARIVLITGHRDELEQVIQGLVADGADAVCYKPFDVPRLVETVRKLALTTKN
ncbi:MAG: response regulator [Planctomycetaceae bacterium]